MDKSSCKELDSKATLAFPSINSTKTQLKATWLLAKALKENADLLTAPIMDGAKKNEYNQTQTPLIRKLRWEEGGIGIVHINRVRTTRVEFVENVGAFFFQGQRQLSVIIRLHVIITI